jgi:plasmid stability protein
MMCACGSLVSVLHSVASHACPPVAYVCITYGAIVNRMGTLVQIRDVPEDVHHTLKARAAASGVSFSEYLRTVLTRSASRPTPAELSARIAARGSIEPDESSVRAVRSIRDHGE